MEDDSIVQQVHDSLSDLDWTPSQHAKKAKVAVTGGVVTAAGLVLIPAPVPIGCVVTAYGVSILATEFDGLQDGLEHTKKMLEGSLERVAQVLQVSDDEENDDILQDLTTNRQDKGESSSEEVTALVVDDGTSTTTAITKRSSFPQRPPELKEIMSARISLGQKAGKIWELHKFNVRKVTCYFISEVVLPTLRNLKVPQQQPTTEQQSSTDEPQTRETQPSVAHTETPSLCESSVHSFAESIMTTNINDGGSLSEGHALRTSNIDHTNGRDTNNNTPEDATKETFVATPAYARVCGDGCDRNKTLIPPMVPLDQDENDAEEEEDTSERTALLR